MGVVGAVVAGLQVAAPYNTCWVNDNGPANIPVGPGNFGQAGFTLITAGGYSFATPQGYKPMGVVSVICTTPAYIAARGW
jgi:hypothetical protein